MITRYEEGFEIGDPMSKRHDGGWVLYADHVNEMKEAGVSERRNEQKIRRDDLAKAAMQGLLSSYEPTPVGVSDFKSACVALAEEAYEIADAMIAEGAK